MSIPTPHTSARTERQQLSIHRAPSAEFDATHLAASMRPGSFGPPPAMYPSPPYDGPYSLDPQPAARPPPAPPAQAKPPRELTARQRASVHRVPSAEFDLTHRLAAARGYGAHGTDPAFVWGYTYDGPVIPRLHEGPPISRRNALRNGRTRADANAAFAFAEPGVQFLPDYLATGLPHFNPTPFHPYPSHGQGQNSAPFIEPAGQFVPDSEYLGIVHLNPTPFQPDHGRNSGTYSHRRRTHGK